MTLDVLTQIFIIFLAAKVMNEIFIRINQSPVIGELLVGIILGPSLLGIIGHSEVLDVLAEIGAIILLFMVGLETSVEDLKKVGTLAITVAILGVVFPFGMTYVTIMALGYPQIEALFVGAALVATSIGITARVLADMGLLDTKEAKLILAAAIVDDILGMIVLTMVSGMAQGSFSIYNTVVIIIEAILFIIAILYFGRKMLSRATGRHSVEQYRTIEGDVTLKYKTRVYRQDSVVDRLRQKDAPFIIVLLACFGISALAQRFGLAAIIGAFFAGMLFTDTKGSYDVEEKMHSVYVLMTPFFFVVMGSKVDLGALASFGLIGLLILLSAVAIISKLLGGYLGALRMGAQSALVVGAGLVPRGEVGIIVAAVGLNVGTIGSDIYSVIVMVSIITTLYAPPLIRTAYGKKSA